MPDAYEIIYHGALGYSLSKSGFDRICYIAPQTHYINLGFFFGTHLSDQSHMLEGEGKRMRHIKVKTINDAKQDAIKALLREAWEDGLISIPLLHKKFQKEK